MPKKKKPESQPAGESVPPSLPLPPSTAHPISDSAEVRKEEYKARHEQMRTDMLRSFVTEPLLSRLQGNPDDKFDVIIALNETFVGGMPKALAYVTQRAEEWKVKYSVVSHYLFACLSAKQILDLADEARELVKKNGPRGTVIYRIWEDTEIAVSLTRSIGTVKVDAAQRSFHAWGKNIVWAVLDSGINGNHPHFKTSESPIGAIDTMAVEAPLTHTDFTPLNNGALCDEFGHGTHVAGIIAGYWATKKQGGEFVAGTEMRNEQNNEPMPQVQALEEISGMAPLCSVLSMKVIADKTSIDPKQTAGAGKVSWVLKAIDQIQQWNQYGRRILVHGVNMSLGYDFDPRWFACGQSPICVEVNRLVRCGVSVVVSAGNAGYSAFLNAAGKSETRYNDLSITDPGNADLAITVGSTHRDMPHLYGVSYFSSRGPTGDGRMKPDLVAPGERIVSCAAGLEAAKYAGAKDPDGNAVTVLYCEQTGTSMSAPHVSGAVAAFLSVRREFIGEPERVKEIFLANTIDLRRERAFQGAGLLDLMKVLQAV